LCPPTYIAAGSWERQVTVFDVATGAEKARHTWTDYRFLQQVAFSRDGKRLALSFENGKFIDVWDVTRRKVVWSASVGAEASPMGRRSGLLVLHRYDLLVEDVE
jgi:WD40 repeat protein